MELDLSLDWHLFLASPESPGGFLPPERLEALSSGQEAASGPAEKAAAEFALGFAALSGKAIRPGKGSEAAEAGVVILDAGSASSTGMARKRGFAWRAAPGRVEIHGDSAAGLLAGAWDILDKAGLRWPAPGLPPAPPPRRAFVLPAASGRRSADGTEAVMILGHGSYLEAAPDYLDWAGRNGYAGLFFHTTPERLALGAAPQALYETMRGGLSERARVLGLRIELGGHGLSALLPRSLFRGEPSLFRMSQGRRRADRNFCGANPRSLAIVKANFRLFAKAHPEVEVFHFWPDDLPGGGWCSCPDCASLEPAAQSLRVAIALAGVLTEARPGARLSFLAYHDTEDLGSVLAGRALPANLELLWAPRLRSWAAGYGDPDCDLNAASSAKFERAREAWLAAGGKGISVFEYWEDAILFKTAVPPLAAVMAKDTAWYKGRADKVGILLTGDRLPLAPRPNPWLLPRLLAGAGSADPEALLREWLEATYGPADLPMARYWAALEAAWSIDLDLKEGDSAVFLPEPMTKAAAEPFADWGDPWKAGFERLAERRAGCEELFGRLREAEAALAEAGEKAASAGEAGAAGGWQANLAAEAKEYAISCAVLELDCARLSAYHELAAGQVKAAADIALIGRSVLDAVRRAQKAVPDRRARKNGGFLLFVHYELRLRWIMGKARGRASRFLGEKLSLARLALLAGSMAGLWEPPGHTRRGPDA